MNLLTVKRRLNERNVQKIHFTLDMPTTNSKKNIFRRESVKREVQQWRVNSAPDISSLQTTASTLQLSPVYSWFVSCPLPSPLFLCWGEKLHRDVRLFTRHELYIEFNGCANNRNKRLYYVRENEFNVIVSVSYIIQQKI